MTSMPAAEPLLRADAIALLRRASTAASTTCRAATVADAALSVRRSWSCSVVYVGLIALDRLAVLAAPDRLHPAAGPGLPDHRRPAAARRLARRAPMRWCSRRHDRPSSRPRASSHVVPFAGLDGATFTVGAERRRRSSPALEPFDDARRRGRCRPTEVLANAAHASWHRSRRPSSSSFRRRRSQGIGNRRRLQDDGGGPRRPRTAQALDGGGDRIWWPPPTRRPASPGVFTPVQHAHAADLCRHRPREGARCWAYRPTTCSRRSKSISARPIVNDFNYLGRTYPRHGPGGWPVPRTVRRHRQSARRAATPGEMVPLGAGGQFQRHHRPLPRAALQPLSRRRKCRATRRRAIRPATALAAMEKLAAESPARGLRLRMDRASPSRRSWPATPASLVFGAAVVFVFLVLAAQYESWSLPLSVILIVPMCLLARGERPAVARHGRSTSWRRSASWC